MSNEDNWVGLGHWDDVAAGLRMFMAYIITTVAFAVLVLVITIGVASSGDLSALRSIATVAKVSGVVGLGIGLFGLAAIARYGRISPVTGARGTAQAALIFGGLSLAISLVALTRLMGTSDLEVMAETTLWDLLARVLGVVQFFCFVASLRTTAGYIGRLDLHHLAGQVMLLAGITVALMVFSQLLTATKAGAIVLLFGLGVLGIGIWCLVYLLMLVSRLARAVLSDARLPETFA
jgi:hypothetical protein